MNFTQITVDPKYLNLDLAYKIEPWEGQVPQREGKQTGCAVYFLGSYQPQCEIVVGVTVAELMSMFSYSPPETDVKELF